MSYFAATAAFLLATADAQTTAQASQKVCMGDTRGDRRCAHDATHRVCAKIGNADTSFWQFTGQSSWCGTAGVYNGAFGSNVRCPPAEPTWCICKWATASWIKGEGCNDNVEIDCAATDVCATTQGLFFVYDDFNVDLRPARECVKKKCSVEWAACESANPDGPHGNFAAGETMLVCGLGGIALMIFIGLGIVARLNKKRYERLSSSARTTAAGPPHLPGLGANETSVTVPGVVVVGRPGGRVYTGLVAPPRGSDRSATPTAQLAAPLV